MPDTANKDERNTDTNTKLRGNLWASSFVSKNEDEEDEEDEEEEMEEKNNLDIEEAKKIWKEESLLNFKKYAISHWTLEEAKDFIKYSDVEDEDGMLSK